MASKDLWQGHKEQKCGDIKKEQSVLAAQGAGRRSDHSQLWPGLGLFYISTMQRLAETSDRADWGGFYRDACSVPA